MPSEEQMRRWRDAATALDKFVGRRVSGFRIYEPTESGSECLVVYFDDGSAIRVEALGGRLAFKS